MLLVTKVDAAAGSPPKVDAPLLTADPLGALLPLNVQLIRVDDAVPANALFAIPPPLFEAELPLKVQFVTVIDDAFPNPALSMPPPSKAVLPLKVQFRTVAV